MTYPHLPLYIRQCLPPSEIASFAPKCGETKTLDQFGRAKDRVDGLRLWCKACRKVEGAADFQKHRAKRVTKHKEWKSSNPGKMGEYSRRWIERNPEKRKAIDNARNARVDPAQHRANVMASYWRDPGKVLARNKAWREANRDKVAMMLAAYRQANPEIISAAKRSYKARKNGAEGSHTGDDVKRIIEDQKWRCVYCDASLLDGYHVDHIIPLSKGGSNWPDNLQCLCGPCNLRKKDKDPLEFARSLELSAT